MNDVVAGKVDALIMYGVNPVYTLPNGAAFGEALANENDVLIGISTGGTSKNIIHALNSAKALGCKTIGFSGKDGGEFSALCDVNLIVAAEDTPRIQEMHILIGHIICHLIDLEYSP